MDICLLNDSFPPIIDGVSNTVVNYARVLYDMGDSPLVGTPEYPGAVDDYPYPVIRYPSLDTTKLLGYRTGIPLSYKLFRGFEGRRLDLIHCHCPMVSAILARGLRLVKDAPIIFTYHTKFDIDIANITDARLIQNAAEHLVTDMVSACDEVWVVSRGAGENLEGLGYQGKWRVMENGVDLPKGTPPEAEVHALRRQLELPEDVPVFLFVGRMMWYKGLHLILEGLARAKAQGARFRMLFVGGGGDMDAVRDLAMALEIMPWCRFVGKIHDRELLRRYYALAELLLFPSTFDTFGLAVREAAACATASLLIRDSAAAEGVMHGENGLLIPEDSAALAQEVLAVCRDPAPARELGRRAMDSLYLSWDTAVARAREQYQTVVERWRAGERHHSPGILKKE